VTRGCALAIVVAASAGIASADDPKPDRGAEEKATEANLESIAPREGVTISAALGGATFFGLGTQNAVGRGGQGSLRLGHVATPRTIITFELTFMNMLHEENKQVFTNTEASLLAGAQRYTSQSLWLRGAAGASAFVRTGLPGSNSTLIGPSALFAIGLDLLRRHLFTLDLQLTTIGMANSEGVVATIGFALGANYY
jgi:hypothetical protein